MKLNNNTPPRDGLFDNLENEWLSTEEAASYLSISPNALRIMVYREQLKAKRGNEESALSRIREWRNGEQARVTREFCGIIGVTPVKFHDLRATFITNLLARGESLARVMSIVGHHQTKLRNQSL